eukprot:scaffold1785_cov247-Pinguiococcus_pyrenoidosus.AAC.23
MPVRIRAGRRRFTRRQGNARDAEFCKGDRIGARTQGLQLKAARGRRRKIRLGDTAALQAHNNPQQPCDAVECLAGDEVSLTPLPPLPSQ